VRPLTPGAQTEQSVRPAPQAGQQSPPGQPPAPQPTAPPAPEQAAPATPPAGQVPPPPGVKPPGRESVPSQAPVELPLVPPVAPNFKANPAEPLPELGRVGVNMFEQRPLSLREAIAMALANNKDIEVARQNVRIAEFDLTAARGAYDPRFSSSAYYERVVTPTASFLGGGPNGAVTQTDYTGTARLEGLMPRFGGSYRIDVSSIRLTTDNQFVALNPQYPTALTLTYTQPLVRGFSFDSSRRQIEIAKKNLSLTDAQFRQRAIETITNVQRAYWDLVFALRNLQVQRDAVRDARRQLDHNKRLVAEGMLAPIDVVAAEAQISGFEQSVYSALEDISRAENNLKNLIAENRESPFWNVALIPTDAVDLDPPAIDLAEAIKAALDSRPELQQSNLSREINQIDQRYYREQTRPQVDLVGTYGVSGLAGTVSPSAANNPFTASTAQLRDRVNQLSQLSGLPPLPPLSTQTLPDVLIGGYGQSVINLFANRYPTARVGVQISLPLRNRTAEAQLGRSLVEGQRIATQREQLEQSIQVDVRNALQAVRTAESRLRAAAAARDASEKQYASEQRKFDAGQSTMFLLLERQTALTNARGSELRAQTDLNKAIADLQRAMGNTLESNKVVVSAR
jgi:HAE1 family hydrophobic/amphiphilic exporter-1